MKFNLCIPIPIRNSKIQEINPIINKALNTKPNLIELRFDYITDFKTISVEFLKNLLKIISPHAAVIFTFRDSSEGGQNQIQQNNRFKIYKMFIAVKPNYIDIEMNTDIKFLDEVINSAYQKGVNLILSYHDFERTLTFDETVEYLQNFNSILTQELEIEQKLIEGIIYKVIFTANVFEDNLIPLKLCKEFSNSTNKIISFCMGPLGILSRINCVIAGSYLTYAFLDEKTAQGQINIEKMREIYNLIQD